VGATSVLTARNTLIPSDQHRQRRLLYGAEIFNNSGNRSPFKTNMHDFGPGSLLLSSPSPILYPRRRRLLLWAQHEMTAGASSIPTDSLPAPSEPNCPTSIQLGFLRFVGVYHLRGPCTPRHNFTEPYSLSNPYPNGSSPFSQQHPPAWPITWESPSTPCSMLSARPPPTTSTLV